MDPGDDRESEDGDESESEELVERHTVVVGGERAGERLDAVLAAALPELSRAQAQRLIDDGRVSVDGAPVAKASRKARAFERIEVAIPAPVAIELVPEPIPLAILHEDADVIVVDKPAGLVVHPAAGHLRGTLVNALLHHCRDLGGIGGELRPGIVHRLDKDTSGVMIAAKTERAHTALVAAFTAKSLAARGGGGDVTGGILREYLGIASPTPAAAKGTLRTFHGRHPSDRTRFSSRVTWGKTAVTHFRVVEPLANAALVRFRLETGRTHQIRVHAADHGWPLAGDALYGGAPLAGLARQALHAALLELDHPVTGERLRFEAPLPADLQAALAALRPVTRSST
ncbi:MAG: RluA family pseudouridine synthase [Deltaproteobacteria bacterium]|nr:RluA family pseudouridine synthase [Deltaproteobacteria bacterium]